jgi:hypothetical protein
MGNLLSVIPKTSHPIRPDRRGVVYSIASVPFQLPQLLKPYLSDGKIHKTTVHKAIVPVDAETLAYIKKIAPHCFRFD